MKVLKSILSSYAFFTVSATPGSNLDKERKKPYVLLAYLSTGERERETEKLQLPENQNSFLPSAAYHPTTERDLQRTCAKVSLSDLQAGTGWFKHTKHLL